MKQESDETRREVRKEVRCVAVVEARLINAAGPKGNVAQRSGACRAIIGLDESSIFSGLDEPCGLPRLRVFETEASAYG